VLLDQVVQFTFSKALDPATVDGSSLTVTDTVHGTLTGVVELVADGVGRTLTWTSPSYFTSGLVHSARASTSLRSTDGLAPTGSLVVSFRTTFAAPPLGLPTASQLGPTVGELQVGRAAHRDTLLNDGRVLLTGGFAQGSNVTNSAETYSPLLGTFTELADPMLVGRAQHSATRLADGKVLIAGGWVQTGLGDVVETRSAEIFDPVAGDFSPTGDLVTARADHAALLLPDGRVLITGGSQLDALGLLDLDDAELYDPATGTFAALASLMVTSRAAHVMLTTGDGLIVVHGGSFSDLRPERFNPATLTFQPIAAAASDSPRFGAVGAPFANGDVGIAGGDDLGRVLHYDFAFARMGNTGSGLTHPRSYATATAIDDDKILIAGGIDFSKGSLTLASCDALIEGGIGGSRTFATELVFPHGLGQHTATRLQSGDVLFCGGVNSNGFSANYTEAFLLDLTP
jgi:hypothetical protein